MKKIWTMIAVLLMGLSSFSMVSAVEPAELVNPVFVTPEWVHKVQAGEQTEVSKYVVAEVTWGEAKDSKDYLTKHIPGAIHINTDIVEEGPIWNLRSDKELLTNFAAQGVDKDTTLILYGPDTGTHRVAWAALYLGVANVKVIDGGLQAWEAAGYETETDEVQPTPVDTFGAEAALHPEYTMTLDQVLDQMANNENFRLVSIRSEGEWLGKESGYSYIPKAGEPKGAVWGRASLRGSNETDSGGMSDFLNEDGTVKNFAEISAMWEAEGFTVENELSFYCGTGWRSCLPWLLMYERGYTTGMFDGGWNEWQMHDELEAQVGDPKSDDVQYVKVSDLSGDKATNK